MKRSVLIAALALCLLLSACGAPKPDRTAPEPTGHMALEYAENFSVDYYGDDAALLTVAGSEQYLLLEHDAAIPQGFADVPVIRCPVEQVYLASSSVADLFAQLDALGCVRFTSTKASDWRLPAMQEALSSGSTLYAGKFSAPDYELLLEQGSDLVVENTMIFHEPATREKLEALGFPVLVEYSSYEPHPLGRVEWIKLYGLLTGRLAEAEAFFAEQAETVRQLSAVESTGRTVAFFYITPSGAVVVRKSADYVTRMIELAGGASALTDLPEDDSALSSVTIQMESFYAQAKDADELIYNSTVPGDLTRLEDLLAQAPLLSDCRAVQSGEVWCTEQSMFQQTSATAGMITDMHRIFSGEADNTDRLQFMHRVK